MQAAACALLSVLTLSCSSFIQALDSGDNLNPLQDLLEYEQDWGYVDVRPGAHKFWWLFKTTHPDGYSNRPLILWLQGGPGASSCGYGNFVVIGPVGTDLQHRNASWIQEASLLFVDHPVGAGFSYVDGQDRLTTNSEEDAEDLLSVFTHVLLQHPEFQSTPIYVFGQSYGGKMGAAFVQRLYQAVQNEEIVCNLRGLAMGNAWISGEDSTMTWGPFLYWMSIADEDALDTIMTAARLCQQAIHMELWENATLRWRDTQFAVLSKLAVDFYNILHLQSPFYQRRDVTDQEESEDFPLFPPDDQTSDLYELMDGVVRDYLAIIPDHVHWGQFREEWSSHTGDFMRPVIHIIDDLLAHTDLDIIVYQGQLDLICDTVGALQWVRKLTWGGITDFFESDDEVVMDESNETTMFVKQYGNLHFYRIMQAGHAVPKDQPETALRMLRRILGDEL